MGRTKFFNVFGPNEYHKGEMMSFVAKRFDDAKAGAPVRLFKSNHPAAIGDGEQKRDFIYVDDAVAVVRWLIKTPAVSGFSTWAPAGRAVSRSDRRLVCGARSRVEYRLYRHAARDQRQLSEFHPGRDRQSAACRL